MLPTSMLALAAWIAVGTCPAGAASTKQARPGPRRAFLMSLLVPGWGQHALDHDRRAALFISFEGGFWFGALGMRAIHGIYEDDYRAFAASTAGARVEGKGRTYFNDLAFYDTRELHNQAALVFSQPNLILYGIEDDWQWPTTAERMEFRHRLNRARLMDRRLDYVLLAITLNHLASAIDAAKLAGRATRAGSGNAMNLRIEPMPDGGRAVCSLHF